MKRYESSIPRIACGIAAMVMTTITIGLLVVLPSTMEPDSQAFPTVQVAKALTTTQSNASDGSV
jgi:uncharacterized membrane protein YkgB